ncbi:hypothetical protein BpHYR1_038560 [Brachionus plicatilis]|uniref:Uncharacterized protein n=1 Tax=Brachionus plicatilis TaxID=10195 RepID=A0A3M7R3M7_BRAPC|nr:hypothetical protein BpHYR1_038560 [Brachionus plicatilis]
MSTFKKAPLEKAILISGNVTIFFGRLDFKKLYSLKWNTILGRINDLTRMFSLSSSMLIDELSR